MTTPHPLSLPLSVDTLTIRDRFAIACIDYAATCVATGLAKPTIDSLIGKDLHYNNYELTTRLAYMLADEMLIARERPHHK